MSRKCEQKRHAKRKSASWGPRGVESRRKGVGPAAHMYVDHAATTPVRPEVLAAMLPYLTDEWGNPSSLYGPGRRAANALNRARDTLADILDCAREEIIFTGSGSEGANLAIKGLAFAAARHGKRHLITSSIEHYAVLDTCRWLA